ncbi:MAG: cell division protein ZipA, partial [Marinobacter sp.]
MSLREWLIAIGTLVIIGIVVDGIRRMHRARKESIAISSGMGVDELDDSPLDQDFNPELPNGGARIVSRGTLEENGYLKSDHSESLNSLDDDSDFAPESGWGAERDDAYSPDQPEERTRSHESAPVEVPDEASHRSADDVDPVAEDMPSQRKDVVSDVQEDTANRQFAQRDANRPLAGANRPEAKEVLVINVLSPQDKPFEGAVLKKLFEACGLEFGDLDIYHRHEGSDTTTPVQFSVASAVEPGTFRPEDMPALSTPGISFFMSLPGPTNALQAFE